MNTLPPFFNAQFHDDNGDPLDGGLLYTYISGTTTPQLTYSDEAGVAANTNPIVLDSAGRCDLWLDPGLEYRLVLRNAADVMLKTWDNVSGTVGANDVVASVNGETGAVVLTADDIAFATITATTWFGSQADVTAALDALIGRVDALPAASVPIADVGNLITATTVEGALAELATVDMNFVLPSQAGNSGRYLTTNGTAPSWAVVALPAFTASIAGGAIEAFVDAGVQSYGSRTCTATGGTSPYTYSWQVQEAGANPAYAATPGAATTAFGGLATAAVITALATCIVTDAAGRVTTATVAITATHAGA